MFRNPSNATAVIDSITAIAEGDGPGAAEPYLWVVFFKLDGDTLSVSVKLDGVPTYVRRPGDHGNLWGPDPMAGDTVRVPSTVGWWRTTLKPIPASELARQKIREETKRPDFEGWDDLPAYIGYAYVLMEEDNLSDAAALAGYEAFVSTLQSELNALIPTIRNPEDVQVEPIKAAVKEAVKKAIRNHLDTITTAVMWAVGPDQTLASGAHFVSQDELREHGKIEFRDRNTEGTDIGSIVEFFTEGPGSFIETGGEWEVHGFFQGGDILPPKTYRVECVEMGALLPGRPPRVRTLGVRDVAGGERELKTHSEVMALIERGDQFFTEDAAGHKAWLSIVEPLDDTQPRSFRHLTTSPDGIVENNLWSMPPC